MSFFFYQGALGQYEVGNLDVMRSSSLWVMLGFDLIVGLSERVCDKARFFYFKSLILNTKNFSRPVQSKKKPVSFILSFVTVISGLTILIRSK